MENAHIFNEAAVCSTIMTSIALRHGTDTEIQIVTIEINRAFQLGLINIRFIPL